jgi:hypothetical protein
LGGSIRWWIHALAEKHITLDTGEYFRKQSYHNRLYILSANGKLALGVPTAGGHFHRPLHSIQISYAHIWQPKFKQALQSAYGSSPYYPYYDYMLEPLLIQEYQWLHELAFDLTKWANAQLKTGIGITCSNVFIESPSGKDYRQSFDAKREIPGDIPLQRYSQTFEHKFGFVPDLSILDLLFNLGPSAGDYLLSHANKLMHG